jgi:NAD(P)-dependent dehydrogenase (short-subunit alcohol dehydrogenase family)
MKMGGAMPDFEGQVVLVTGAGRGMGRSVAQVFARQGAIVAANDITPINLDETIAGIQNAGGRVKSYIFDIAKRLPAQALVEQVLEDWGRLDVLVNHANVKPRAAILDMDEWDWQRTLDVNLSGAFYLMQEAGRAMRAQGGGVVLNIGSLGEQVEALKGRAAYIASNNGLAGLTRAAADEFAAYNIRVNMVSASRLGATLNPELILHLCSPSAAHINGQIIHAST